MKKSLNRFLNERALPFFRKRFEKVIEINRRYAQPRLKMTTLVRYSLLALRIYLLLLVALLFYKFITLIK
jgi:hypothetical protein